MALTTLLIGLSRTDVKAFCFPSVFLLKRNMINLALKTGNSLKKNSLRDKPT